MGCIQSSKPQLIDDIEGGEDAYHTRFLEDKVLGEGQFGTVKLVHDMTASKENTTNETLLACKCLKKGITFKDNTLYSPIKPEVLKQECNILRTLMGKHFCLKLVSIYETPRVIYMITELCVGGEMMEYISKQSDELSTEDVSRIAFQLLDAVSWCDKHHVMHRDIKPENIMFINEQPKSDLRLIDFGSGCIDGIDSHEAAAANLQHTTFAGSAFYISPEMFQKTYTSKTDVWSVGATLYVLVAGYPADELQKAFNILQKSKNRNLRSLPNLPGDLPDSYYDMLDELLNYRHKQRKSASDMLSHDFVTFWKQLEDEEREMGGIAATDEDDEDECIDIHQIAAEAADPTAPTKKESSTSLKNGSIRRLKSIKIHGSVHRHTQFLGYQKYERAVTTLLATLLIKTELITLLRMLKEYVKKQSKEKEDDEAPEIEASPSGNVTVQQTTNEQKLSVIPIDELKKMLNILNYEEALQMVNGLPNSSMYDKFAYHIALLREFAPSKSGGGGSKRRSSKKEGLRRVQSIAGGGDRSFMNNGSVGSGSLYEDDSLHSQSSRASSKINSSAHGSNVYSQWTSRSPNNDIDAAFVRENNSTGGGNHFGRGNSRRRQVRKAQSMIVR